MGVVKEKRIGIIDLIVRSPSECLEVKELDIIDVFTKVIDHKKVAIMKYGNFLKEYFNYRLYILEVGDYRMNIEENNLQNSKKR